MGRKAFTFVGTITLAFGILIMLYPAVSSLINARTQSQVIDGYEEAVETLLDESIEALREEAALYNEKLKNSAVVMTDPFSEDAVKVSSEDYEKTLDVDGTGLMGFIDIAAIGVHLPIYHGTSQSVLSRAVGHLEGTSLPIGGESTHSVLSAHTGLTQAKLFTDLDELVVGDTFSITVLNETMTYEIYDIEIVEPKDVSSLTIEEGKDLCTLVTCTPYGVNSHRLLVHGTRIPAPEETPADTPAALQSVTFSQKHLLIGGVVAFAAILMLLLRLRREKKRRRRIDDLWRQLRK